MITRKPRRHSNALKTKVLNDKPLSKLDAEMFGILWRIIRIRENIREKNLEAAVFNALLLNGGELRAECGEQLEPDIKRGRAAKSVSRKAASALARQQKSANMHSKIVAAAQKRLKSGISPRNLASALMIEFLPGELTTSRTEVQ